MFSIDEKFQAALSHCIKSKNTPPQKDIAKILDISPQYLANLKAGKRAGKESLRRDLARFFGYEYEAFLKLGQDILEVRQEGERRLAEIQQETYSDRDVTVIPVFDAEAGEPSSWTNGGSPVGKTVEYMPVVNDRIDSNTFAVSITNDQMEPRLAPGDRVVVNPTEPLQQNCLCFAALPDGRRLVREYRRLPDGRVLLSCTNPAYDPIILENVKQNPDIRIMRVVWCMHRA